MTGIAVGQVLPRYCGGIFPLDTTGETLRVEFVAADWIVVRDEGGHPYFYSGDLWELAYSAGMR